MSYLPVTRLQTPATPHLDAHFNAQQRPSPPANGRVMYPPQYGLRVDPGSDYMVSDGAFLDRVRSHTFVLAEIVSDFFGGGRSFLKRQHFDGRVR